MLKEQLEKIAAGDEKAFTSLFYEYHQQLGDYLLSITQSHDITREIVQETFVKIWTMRSQLPEISSFRSWLFTVCRNSAYNALRDQARNLARLESWSRQQPEADYQHTGEQTDYSGLLSRAVAQLPLQQRTAYSLSRQEGLKYDQIAERMGISKATVKRHIHIALQSIASFLREHAGDSFVIILVEILFKKNS